MERLPRQQRIVDIGGGTGLSTLLKAQTLYIPRSNLSAIITTSDEGGDYKRWREWFGVVAGGDIRKASGPLGTNPYFNTLKEFRFPDNSGSFDGLNVEDIIFMSFEDCFRGFKIDDPVESIISVRRGDPFLKEILKFSFHSGDQKLDKACIGNILLAVSEMVASSRQLDVNTALEHYQRIFGIEGRLIPTTLSPTTLVAEFEKPDDPLLKIVGEDNIGSVQDHLNYHPDMVLQKLTYQKPTKLNPLAKQAILNAQKIYIAMGSVYTSVMAPSLAEEFNETLEESGAEAEIVIGIMATRGESYHLRNASDHLRETQRYFPGLNVTRVLINDHRGYEFLPETIKDRYKDEGKVPVLADRDRCELIYPKAEIEIAPLIFIEPENLWIRHNTELLGYHLYHRKVSRPSHSNLLSV